MPSRPPTRSDFRPRLYELVARIPAGSVATYGDLARLCGMPNGARQVGWAMSSPPDGLELPWWRVVNRGGVPAHAFRERQAELLRQEGVAVSADGAFEVDRYRWDGPEDEA